MSQENVEVVRGMLQAFAESGLDAMAEFWDPNISHRAAEGAIDDAGELQGSAAVRRYTEGWMDTFDGFAIAPQELRDAGDDRVVAALQLTGRVKISGAETELRFAVVYTVRDGKIVRGREYMTLEEALEAVGLRE